MLQPTSDLYYVLELQLTHLDKSIFIIALFVLWTSDQGFVKVFWDMRGNFWASMAIINWIGREGNLISQTVIYLLKMEINA